MLQVREMRFHCSNDLVVLLIYAHFEGALVALLQKMCFVGSNASFSLMLLYRHFKPVVGNLFNRRVICRKSKTPPSRKTSLLCPYKYGKECKFYIK